MRPAQEWQSALDRAAHADSSARMLVLEVPTGKIVASRHLHEAAHTLAAPGSTLKPIVLYQALQAGNWNADRRVFCTGDLTIVGHRLACSHPTGPALNARQALAWSCNAYFAQVARTMSGAQFGEVLRGTGLLARTGLAADEASAAFVEPRTTEDIQLAVLGIKGIRVSPLELAYAYRSLAREISAHRDTPAASIVQQALQDATAYGTAQGAGHQVWVAGKTGTAEGVASKQTHGWFAGLVPAQNPEAVLLVYLPAGRGADAAQLAGRVLAALAAERK